MLIVVIILQNIQITSLYYIPSKNMMLNVDYISIKLEEKTMRARGSRQFPGRTPGISYYSVSEITSVR